jgi:hypothetical protein
MDFKRPFVYPSCLLALHLRPQHAPTLVLVSTRWWRLPWNARIPMTSKAAPGTPTSSGSPENRAARHDIIARSHPHGQATLFKVSSPIPVIVGHASPMYRTFSREHDGRQRAYDQPGGHGHPTYSTPDDVLRRTARHLGDAVIGGHLRLGISRHGNTQYPMGKLDLHEGKSHKAVYYGITTALSAEAVRIPCPFDVIPSSSRKVASRSRVHHRTSLHRWRTHDSQAHHRLPPQLGRNPPFF